MPKVSVIIPNYNHAPYLHRRIDSVLNQTYTDFELILLDDSSTDNSKEILLSYSDNPNVSHIVINEQNGGNTFKQWEKGFQLAKGDFIWIAESDDWCELSLLENLVNPMLNNSEIVLSYCQSMLVSESNEIVYLTTNKLYGEILHGNDFVAERMLGDTKIVNAGMVIFRKSVLSKIENRYLKMQSAGDWMFWVEVALQGNVYISAKYLNYFNRHSGSVSSKAMLNGVDMTEGNDIFSFIATTLKPDDELVKKALRERINIYFQQKNNYSDDTIRSKVKNQLLHLHPIAKKIIFKRQLRNLLKFD
jgi:glycosyltransferase involved in cell wall biosynthesis